MSTTSTLDVTDFFCGMGGSSTGLVAAGFQVKLAADLDHSWTVTDLETATAAAEAGREHTEAHERNGR